MEKLNEQIRHVMLRKFTNNKKKATETVKKTCSVYGQVVITDRQVRNWFSKFRFGNTSLKDERRPGCSLDYDQDALRELVKCNLRKTTRVLVLDLNTSQSITCRHFKKVGIVDNLGFLASSHSE